MIKVVFKKRIIFSMSRGVIVPMHSLLCDTAHDVPLVNEFGFDVQF